jgi:hypothetical protein
MGVAPEVFARWTCAASCSVIVGTSARSPLKVFARELDVVAIASCFILLLFLIARCISGLSISCTRYDRTTWEFVTACIVRFEEKHGRGIEKEIAKGKSI